MKRLFRLALLLIVFLFSFARAGAQDEQYVHIYGLIQEGDSLKTSQPAVALAKMLEAQNLLLQFQRLYPDWNSNVVKYRLAYLANGVAEITARHPEALAAVPTTNVVSSIGPAVKPELKPAAGPKAPSEAETQLAALQNQIRQLQSDNSLMESKLKEALRVQPANLDPRALARAEDEIKNLSKENALLKITISTNAPPPGAPEVDAKVLEQVKTQLAEANLRLDAQNERVTALAAEKVELQKKFEEMVSAASNQADLDAARNALEEANRKLAGLTDDVSRARTEKAALQERIKTLTTEVETAAVLRTENEVLKRQLAEAKSLPKIENDLIAKELAEAKAQIALLKSGQNVLRLENAALEKRIKATPPAVTAPTAPPAGAMQVAPVEVARVRQLERERDGLQEKLEAAQKELLAFRSRPGGAKVEELQSEIQMLRTRLAVMETQKMPYTEEEAAVIKQVEAQVIDPRAGKKSSRELPAGSMTLVAEAQKDFAARRFEQAEDKYQQVLKQDEKNVYTLANLAAIQIEMGRFEEADKNIRQALSVAPEDPYSLSLLGFLKFRQNQYDDALDALGRAAKLDPRNAEIQNYLGLTLGQKGMRNAAESALRKAVTLDPNYGSAHYNLAVIYLTHKPQQVELARLHYRKAIAAGMAPSADMERMLNPNPAEPNP
ncbi:MAG: tetratricopeptide repeat protein [Akkermansiaceae bacterium]|nr:tetratricopeptide repeat protein [Verrucomicrobiales bacterium]